MDEESILHAEIRDGSEASQLLESPAFLAAREALLDGLESRRRSVAMTDTTMHARLILAEQCWQAIETWLRTAAETGHMSAFRLDEDRKRRDGLLQRMASGFR